ncbi:helix-turn-helix domain-containing protein [Rickettsiella endosymbiont of Dermanyssus gallinae]|uniref:helix-turn-helix domain-containing protein n=1 Tax=Rickettsiella endosymbiont of Dermanyssus gallinae TaxID=2856608 RepID=UPI001C52D281|nr:helix-turn-helix domain-containing protein [Rickettsiella endosymbiont of Dermanyssus gallinae]
MLKTERKYLKPQTLFLRDRLIERPYNTWELRTKFNIYSPAARITELIKSGYVIYKSLIVVKDVNGGVHRIRQYALVSQFDREDNYDV